MSKTVKLVEPYKSMSKRQARRMLESMFFYLMSLSATEDAKFIVEQLKRRIRKRN